MQYLRSHNESIAQLPSREELKELFTLNLEDNEYFDAARIIVSDVTANSKDVRRQIIIDEDFRESRNPEIIDLLAKIEDTEAHYGVYKHNELKQKFIKLILNITYKLVDKIGRKYGFEIQAIDFSQTNIAGNDFSGLDFPTERISIIIISSLYDKYFSNSLDENNIYDMKNIKSYSEFNNEELDLKKVLIGGALVASMATCRKAEITPKEDDPTAIQTDATPTKPDSLSTAIDSVKTTHVIKTKAPKKLFKKRKMKKIKAKF